MDQINTIKIPPGARGTTAKFGKRRRSIARNYAKKCEPQERNPCAPRFEERTQDETLQQERCARRVAWDLVRSVHKLKKTDKATVALVMPAPSSKEVRGAKNSRSSPPGFLRRWSRPTERCKQNVAAQVYVHDLDLFVTVQIVADTLAVLSLGKLCEEHGYSL